MSQDKIKVTVNSKQISTILDDSLAKKLFNKKGTSFLAIVEIRSEKTHEDLKGDQAVDCTIEAFEPVVDGKLNGTFIDHVRTLFQALNQNRMRAENGDQLPLGDKVGPSNADIVKAGDALIERNELDEPIGIFSHKDQANDPEPAPA